MRPRQLLFAKHPGHDDISIREIVRQELRKSGDLPANFRRRAKRRRIAGQGRLNQNAQALNSRK